MEIVNVSPAELFSRLWEKDVFKPDTMWEEGKTRCLFLKTGTTARLCVTRNVIHATFTVEVDTPNTRYICSIPMDEILLKD